MATTVTWDGAASITAAHNGNGSVTFTLSGRATAHIDTGSSIINTEASYELFCNNVHLAYFSTSTKKATVTLPPIANRTYMCKAYTSYSGTDYYATSGNPTYVYSVPGPEFTWTDGTNITAEQSGQNYIFTINGDAVAHNGYSAQTRYFMWCKDSSTTFISNWYLTDKTFTLTPQYYSKDSIYYVFPYIVVGDPVTLQYWYFPGSSKEYSFKGNGYVVYYDGSQWVKCSMKYYDGTDWVACKPHYYNGSEWIDISSSV